MFWVGASYLSILFHDGCSSVDGTWFFGFLRQNLVLTHVMTSYNT